MKRAKLIEQLIDSKWKSRRSFAEEIGIPPTTLQSILQRGAGKASVDNVIKVCKGLGITVEQLEVMAKVEGHKPVVDNVSFINEKRSVYGNESHYDLIPIPVSAGELSTIEAIAPEQISVPDLIMGKYAGNEDVFFVRVNGDSMNKVIPHESLIAVKRVNLDALQDDDIVVFSNDYEYSVKRYYDDIANKRLVFGAESTDRSFIDHIVPYEECENLVIHGKVVLYIVSP